MNRTLGYGLVLLVAGAGVALAQSAPDLYGAGVYFLGAAAAFSGPSTTHSAQGYLGVDVRDVSSDQMTALRLKEARGAEIVLVDHDAPAGKAGLRAHDVVLKMNGQPIEGEEQIRRMLRESPPGKSIVLLISRDGQQMTITAKMANREEVERKAWEQHLTVPEPTASTEAADSLNSPSPAASASAVHSGNSFIGTILMLPSYTGVVLEPLNTQLAQYFGAASGKGLLVRSVAANSPAAQAGLQVGDVVERADAKPVATTSDWSKAIRNCKGRSLIVIVVREKKEQTITLTPDAKKRSSLEPPMENPDQSPEQNVVAHMGFSWMPRS